jgi:membrane-associated phospholipid phosphatase
VRSATAGPTALPNSLRRAAAWVAAVAAVAVGALGVRYEGLSRSSHTDRVLDRAVQSSVPDKERLFSLIHYLGNPRSVIVLAGLLAVLAFVLSRRRLAVLAVLGPGLTGVATTVLKPVFDRTLGGAPAYPSGHTAALTALAIVTALLLVSLIRVGTVWKAVLVGLAALGAGLAMAVTLTVLDIHYPTDTIGGFGTAVAVVLAAALVLDRVAEARRPPVLRS